MKCITYGCRGRVVQLGVDFCSRCLNDRRADAAKEKAIDTQVGGGHYKGMKIQPIEYCMANGFNACQSHAIKYISRTKGDKEKLLEDRRKAIHCIELEIGFLEGEK